MVQKQPPASIHQPDRGNVSHDEVPEWVISNSRRLAFLALARLLCYPDEVFHRQLEAIKTELTQFEQPAEVATAGHPPLHALADVAYALSQVPLQDLQVCYVNTFDFTEQASLHLTAHEYGDSRQRGEVLLALRVLMRSAGYEPDTKELPDYLPMLLEFLACAPEDVDTEPLQQRLARVCTQIREQLEEQHPYRPVFELLIAHLPAVQSDPAHASSSSAMQAQDTSTQRPARFPRREQADTGEMPYPLHYNE